MNGDNSGRVRIHKGILANDAILFKTKVVHGLVNRLFNLLPIRSSLNEFIHVLEDRISTRRFRPHCANYLRPVGSPIARSVSYDLGKILCVIHNEDVTKHFKVGEIRRDALNLVVGMSASSQEWRIA